jgi:hypothetical protein
MSSEEGEEVEGNGEVAMERKEVVLGCLFP